MRKLGVVCAVVGLVLAVGSEAVGTTFATGVDSMSYNITTWSIRTDWTGYWAGKTPDYFKFPPGWPTRYTQELGATVYTQALSGSAVVTDVFSQADMQAINQPNDPFWATMGGASSPIGFWDHAGRFLKESGLNDSSWADDTYWASNEYGDPRSTGVVTEFAGTFEWDGCGQNGVTGKILADDKAEVYLNNTLIHTTDTCAYDAAETFSYLGVLVPGTNNLEVIVYDTGQGSLSKSPTAGATALQLELDVIPEPLTLLGMFLGLGSVGAYIRRRRMR